MAATDVLEAGQMQRNVRFLIAATAASAGLLVLIFAGASLHWLERPVAVIWPVVPDVRYATNVGLSDIDIDCEAPILRVEQVIEDARVCAVDSDCMVENLGCPFGGLVSLNRAKLPGVLAAFKDYQRSVQWCGQCLYQARAPSGPPVCANQQCGFQKIAVERPLLFPPDQGN